MDMTPACATTARAMRAVIVYSKAGWSSTWRSPQASQTTRLLDQTRVTVRPDTARSPMALALLSWTVGT